jgi:hydrogenase-4 component B
MTFFLVAVLLMLLSAPLSLFASRGSGFWEKSSLVSLLAGSVFGLLAVREAFITPGGISLTLPWAVPGGAFSLAIDGLSAVFLLPAFLLVAAGAIYAVGYWPQKKDPVTGSQVRLFYSLLATGIVLVLVAANAVLFLVAWEIMALAGYFLVTTDRASDDSQKAGFLYLACTHVGTLALFALFALLGDITETGGLPEPGSLDASLAMGSAIFFIALFGFGFKAGLMPLHIWLPRAHAAAPSHVSALMSGVMIKTGIYGIMRVTTLFHSIPHWWGWTILGLGVVSGVLGVVLAIAQHDLKRLLAYHSVENIGIILIGFGTALLGLSYQEPALVVLGMAGSLLHVVNHGLFKGLLFLSAGSMIHATGTRDLVRYGGMLRSMPFTALFFLGGAIAICGLPPLNGFVSEWFVYLGLLQAGTNSSLNLTMAVLAMPALALAGGLALLCFTKVFGLSFLGEPRQKFSGELHEAPPSMLGGMAMLFAACLWIGLLPSTMVPLLTKGIAAWPAMADIQQTSLEALAPSGAISLAAVALLLLIGVAWLVSFLLNRQRKPASCTTWGCGYLFGTNRMQYTVSSFAQMVGDLFHWARWTRTSGDKVSGLFPGPASLATHTPDAVLDLVVMPACLRIGGLADKVHRIFHHGLINIYMLYIAIALGLLMWLAVS